MGTNYYVKTGVTTTVTCNCGFQHEIEEELHIGKNSYGWMFTLHVIPEKGINELRDWVPILWNGKIRNEYGDEITFQEMMKTILKDQKSNLCRMKKKDRENYLNEMNAHSFNKVVSEGKCCLLRSDCCAKGEEGNYCLMSGEFC